MKWIASLASLVQSLEVDGKKNKSVRHREIVHQKNFADDACSKSCDESIDLKFSYLVKTDPNSSKINAETQISRNSCQQRLENCSNTKNLYEGSASRHGRCGLKNR